MSRIDFLEGSWAGWGGVSVSIWLEAGGCPQFLAMWTSPARQLAPSKPARESASRREVTVFYKLVLEVTCYCFSHILFFRSLSLSLTDTKVEEIEKFTPDFKITFYKL